MYVCVRVRVCVCTCVYVCVRVCMCVYVCGLNLFKFPLHTSSYSLSPIPVDMKLKWNAAGDKHLAMPPANSYLPSVKTLASNTVQPFVAAPKLLVNSAGE